MVGKLVRVPAEAPNRMIAGLGLQGQRIVGDCRVKLTLAMTAVCPPHEQLRVFRMQLQATLECRQGARHVVVENLLQAGFMKRLDIVRSDRQCPRQCLTRLLWLALLLVDATTREPGTV